MVGQWSTAGLPRNKAEEERQQRVLKVLWVEVIPTSGSPQPRKSYGIRFHKGFRALKKHCFEARWDGFAGMKLKHDVFASLSCQAQFETLCADAYLNPELNQIMIKATAVCDLYPAMLL